MLALSLPSGDLLAILPEIGLLLLIGISLLLEAIIKKENKDILGWVVSSGVFVILLGKVDFS